MVKITKYQIKVALFLMKELRSRTKSKSKQTEHRKKKYFTFTEQFCYRITDFQKFEFYVKTSENRQN